MRPMESDVQRGVLEARCGEIERILAGGGAEGLDDSKRDALRAQLQELRSRLGATLPAGISATVGRPPASTVKVAVGVAAALVVAIASWGLYRRFAQARFTVVPTPRPSGAGDRTPFVRAGCTQTESAGVVDCGGALPPHACEHMGGAMVYGDPLLAGLATVAPIARCSESDGRFSGDRTPVPASDLPRFGGGMAGPSTAAFVVVDGGKLVVIRTRGELAARFAPVKTEAQALAFAVALSGGQASFDPMSADRSMLTPLVPVVEGTKAVKTAGGFRVNLFEGDVFGCGPKTTYEFEVNVSTAGQVRAERTRALYSEQAGRCAD